MIVSTVVVVLMALWSDPATAKRFRQPRDRFRSTKGEPITLSDAEFLTRHSALDDHNQFQDNFPLYPFSLFSGVAKEAPSSGTTSTSGDSTGTSTSGTSSTSGDSTGRRKRSIDAARYPSSLLRDFEHMEGLRGGKSQRRNNWGLNQLRRLTNSIGSADRELTNWISRGDRTEMPRYGGGPVL